MTGNGSLALASVDKLFEKAYLAQQHGAHEQAIAGYRALLKKKRNHGDANYMLGTLLAMRGELEEARQHLRRAVTLMPHSAMARTNLGQLLRMLGETDEAEGMFRGALRLDPRRGEALNNLAALLIARGAPVEGEQLARRCMNLSGQQRSYGVIQCANGLADQGRSDEALSLLERQLKTEPDNETAWHNYLSMLPYSCRHDRQLIFEEHRRWARLRERPLPAPEMKPGSRIRVGYLSPDLRDHPVGHLLRPLLAAHDRGRFEVHLFHDNPGSDVLSEELRALADRWHSIGGWDDRRCAALIAEQGIDILVDLAGHSANNRLTLFALRTAPIQVAYLGYTSTTGLQNIDYAISDEWFDPVGDEDPYSEQLLRLPRISFAYAPSATAEPDARSEREFTFGSFNSLRKLRPEVIDLWAGILRQCEGSVLILQARGLGEGAMQGRLQQQFEAAGVASTRVELHGFGELQGHLALVRRCDLTLDTWPWNGHMTTLNSLAMGVPTLTLRGDRRSGRMGAAILQQLGLTPLIADSPGHYRQRALELFADRDELRCLAAGLSQRLLRSPVCDGEGLARAMEQAFAKMVASRRQGLARVGG